MRRSVVHGWWARGAALVAAVVLVAACRAEPDHLARLRSGDPLRVVTREVPRGISHAPVNIDRALALRFASWLGVSVTFVPAATPEAARAVLAAGGADIAATGEPVGPSDATRFRLGPDIRYVDEHVLYRRKSPRPRGLRDLAGSGLTVPAGSAAAGLLAPGDGVQVSAAEDRDTPDLMAAVWRKRLAHTVATSEYLTSLRPIYPEVASAFKLAEGLPVTWLFPREGDDGVRRAFMHFMNALRRTGELHRILSLHRAHLEEFDYVATRRLIRRIRKRLPTFEAAFRRAAARSGLDWRFLAAVGYQESHWDPGAVSPTGVKGIMMLTQATADELGVDREDPVASIAGASRYFAALRDRLPPGIPEAERNWFTLAAYNLGLAHLNGVRTLTEMTGGDPNRWVDVQARLPLLRQSRWYSRLATGAARGPEAAAYVARVRRCYDLLRWFYRSAPDEEPT